MRFDPAQQHTLVDPQLDHAVELQSLVVQHLVERLRLRGRAREPVEDEAFLGVRLVDALGHDRIDDVVRDELAPVHDVLGLQPDRRTGLNRGAQHVSG